MEFYLDIWEYICMYTVNYIFKEFEKTIKSIWNLKINFYNSLDLRISISFGIPKINNCSTAIDVLMKKINE